MRLLRHPATGDAIDRALVLRFPGPGSSTGEDLAEFHLHGGRAVVAALSMALEEIEGLRRAEPGEFTRRAFENGRIDLAEAEGLADLLMAESESQRRAALALAGGELSRRVQDWQARLLRLAARVEAALDFSDEGDVGEELGEGWAAEAEALLGELDALLERPPAERLRDGVRVVIAGPPNAGKSSLLNAIVQREAAITSDVPGTTRDVIEAPVLIHGTPFLFADTAGIRESGDRIEAIGVERAQAALNRADIVLWLGDPDHAPPGAITVQTKIDRKMPRVGADAEVSAKTGFGVAQLLALLVERSRALLPVEGELALNSRHRDALSACRADLEEALNSSDLLVRAESLRISRTSLDRITGRAGVEDMLDALFGGFCIGK